MLATVSALADLVFPNRCLGCARIGPALCGECLRTRPERRYVDGVGWVHAAGVYRSPLGVAVVHYKDRRRRDLVSTLGGVLAGAVSTAVVDAGSARAEVVLVPIPSAPAAAAERGGDHMRRLGGVAARRLGLRLDCVLRARPSSDSVSLGPAARRANVAGTLYCRRSPAPGEVAVVVDDILTTGATLGEAVLILGEAGWPVVGAAVIAAAADPHAVSAGSAAWTTRRPGR